MVARPKSAKNIFWFRSPNIKLEGFKSPCTIPFEWMYSRDLIICLPIYNVYTKVNYRLFFSKRVYKFFPNKLQFIIKIKLKKLIKKSKYYQEATLLCINVNYNFQKPMFQGYHKIAK